MGRTYRFTPEELDADQRRVYDAIAGGPRAQGPQAFAVVDDAGRLEGPFNAMLLQPRVGHALQQVGSALRYQGTLGPRAREIAILVVAASWGSAFERQAHEAVGRVVGLSDAELAALRDGRDPALDDPVELAVLRAARALVDDGRLTDAQYAEAVRLLGEPALFELTTIVGYYATLALQLRVFAGE